MTRIAQFASSVSIIALLSSGADANTLRQNSQLPNLVISGEKIAQSPAATDMRRQRVFTVFLKPGAQGAANAVQGYFASFGFRTQYHPDTNAIKLYGSFAQAAQAGQFHYTAGRGPAAPLSVSERPKFPPSIAAAILSTTFNPGPVMQPQFSIVDNAPTTLPHYKDPATGAQVYGLGPGDYARLYGFDNVYAGGWNGAGQTVDIAACYGYKPNDIASYESIFGLSPAPNITAIYPSGHGAYSYSGEPLLDLERVYGTAPGAAIRIWFAPDCTMGEFTNLFEDIANDQAAHPAAAMSVSYGLPELLMAAYSAYPSTFFTGMDAALSKITGGAAQNVALFAASGDDGDDTGEYWYLNAIYQLDYARQYPIPPGTSDVLFPASDPNVLAVGGTTAFLNANGSRKQEVAWSGATLNNDGGSGGGVSDIWPIPSWQKGVAGMASQTYKNVPDVASDASPTSPVLMVAGSTTPVLIASGGTSAASPTWAGTVALIENFKAATGAPLIKDWPQVIYNNRTKFFTDITQGNNGRYSAGPGYDNVTGIGVVCFLHFPYACTNGQ